MQKILSPSAAKIWILSFYHELLVPGFHAHFSPVKSFVILCDTLLFLHSESSMLSGSKRPTPGKIGLSKPPLGFFFGHPVEGIDLQLVLALAPACFLPIAVILVFIFHKYFNTNDLSYLVD